MTSPEWEAANEDDSDRFPQTSHASAPESTESHEQGSRVVPDPARVARYAEAIAAQQLSDHPHGFRDVAAAVVAVADEDRAALVAEVERLRNASKQNAVQASRADRRADRLEARAEAAKAEVERLRRSPLRVTVMADPEQALIEAIEAAIDNATDAPFCPHDGLEHTCHCNTCAARAAYAAMVEHLGLVEETCCDDAYRDREEFGKYSVYTCADMERSCLTRLAQPWPDRMEVDHGSE